ARASGHELEIETASGPHPCRVLGASGDASAAVEREVEVAMRPASLLPAEIGLDAEAPWIDAALRVGEATLRVTAVSMGNPHVVTFDAPGERAQLGPL